MKTYKNTFKIFAIVIFIFLALFTFPIAKTQKKIVVGGDNSFPPFEYVENSEYKGFNVDLMKALAQEMGYEVEFRPMPWNVAVTFLKLGKIDALQGMRYSEERDLIFDFSEPILVNSSAIFVREETVYILSLEDLKGHVVAVQKGDYSAEMLKNYDYITITEFENYQTALEELMKGNVAAFFGNKLVGKYIIQKNKYEEIKIVGGDINPSNYCIAVKEGNTELLSEFNKALKTLKKNGKYDEIYHKWFGEDIAPSKAIPYRYGAVLILILFVIIGFMYVWNFTLTKTVEKKTWELKEAWKFSDRIVNSMSEGILIEDAKGFITFVNPRTCEMLSYTEKELMGKHWSYIVAEDFFQKVEDETTKRHDGVSSKYEAQLLSKSGERIPVIISAKPLFENGKFKGVLTVFTDISQRKTLEEKLKKSKNELEFYVDLLSHDISNINQISLGYLELAQKTNDFEKKNEYLKKALFSVKNSAKLIENVKKIQKASIFTKKEKIDLNKAIEEAINIVKDYPDREIEILYTPKKNNFVVANSLLKDVFSNLIENAIKYTPEKKVKIQIDAFRHDGKLLVLVKDWGRGIPDEMKKVIFERFRRSETGVRGSGVGLYLVKKIVEDFGGRIWVEDNPEGGSMFFVELQRGDFEG